MLLQGSGDVLANFEDSTRPPDDSLALTTMDQIMEIKQSNESQTSSHLLSPHINVNVVSEAHTCAGHGTIYQDSSTHLISRHRSISMIGAVRLTVFYLLCTKVRSSILYSSPRIIK